MHPAAVETYDDHRIAMSFAVAGLKLGGVKIKDPGCVAKTFPDFFDRLAALKLKTNPERFVLGFVKFFGTPLCVAAFLAAMVAVARAREGNWERAALAASIALACAGAGIGAIWWVRFHARPVDPSERLRAANPNAPWMWREDWAAGEVRTSARRDANRLTIIAIAWCVATFPIFLIAPHRALRADDYFAIPSLIFPLIGVVMLIWAMRMRRRLREYGESRFVMASVPGQIGGSLTGSIHIDKPMPARRTSRARTRMHQAHDERTLAQPHDLGLDSLARRSDFDQRFVGIDPGRIHDPAGLPPDRRFESERAESCGDSARRLWQLARVTARNSKCRCFASVVKSMSSCLSATG